uniref:Uncharacterized protein n=1 Tax=Parascaris equorum TaxID=6256 RepID=A0A914S4A2_PAREQ
MIRQYANATASTSSATPPNGAAHPELNRSSTAAKVAEVFLTAGHAFQKLGDLTLQLHSSNGSTTERKLIKTDIKRRTLVADDLTSSVGMPPAKRITTVGQLLAANSANAKRTSAGNPRPRYNPITVLPTATPSVATTITLQSSPQPIATTRAIALLPSEPNRHYLDPSGA